MFLFFNTEAKLRLTYKCDQGKEWYRLIYPPTKTAQLILVTYSIFQKLQQKMFPLNKKG